MCFVPTGAVFKVVLKNCVGSHVIDLDRCDSGIKTASLGFRKI